MKKIVLITGFESFNTDLYRQAAVRAMAECTGLQIDVFSDRHFLSDPEAVATSLKNADVFFASLIFDYDQVMWLREQVTNIPIRLVFESALELMSLTQLGKFVIGEQPKGMPKPIKFILSKFSSGKEEDKLAGYISFLKIGPKLLKFIPGQKVQDLRNWLIIYSYWNAGGQANVTAMFWLIGEKYLQLTAGKIPELIETPNMGLLHPDYQGYFDTPQQYLTWYYQRFPERQVNPVIGILLYRKHVITQQNYIPQLISYFDQAGLTPVPIFINGVEAHVAVRDWLTTETEINDHFDNPKLLSVAVKVDAIVSTIGFPLVGGPAGSIEAGRQIAVAQTILTRKNIPYLIAAPLLIQDLHSWTRQGIGGLQGVVLYALPELDGAIDTIPLGGLVGDQIYLIPERVKQLIGRLKSWVKLRQTPTGDRKIAIILYGFPPGYGATGTAALLNVPRSLVNILTALQKAGYDLGDTDANLLTDGEAMINLVREAEKDEQSENQVSVKVLEKRLGYLLTKRVEKY